MQYAARPPQWQPHDPPTAAPAQTGEMEVDDKADTAQEDPQVPHQQSAFPPELLPQPAIIGHHTGGSPTYGQAHADDTVSPADAAAAAAFAAATAAALAASEAATLHARNTAPPPVDPLEAVSPASQRTRRLRTRQTARVAAS